MKIIFAITCFVLVQISLSENVYHHHQETEATEPTPAPIPAPPAPTPVEEKPIAEYFLGVDAMKSLVNNLLIWFSEIVVDIVFDRLGLIE